eukprot:sb/3476812/
MGAALSEHWPDPFSLLARELWSEHWPDLLSKGETTRPDSCCTSNSNKEIKMMTVTWCSGSHSDFVPKSGSNMSKEVPEGAPEKVRFGFGHLPSCSSVMYLKNVPDLGDQGRTNR